MEESGSRLRRTTKYQYLVSVGLGERGRRRTTAPQGPVGLSLLLLLLLLLIWRWTHRDPHRSPSAACSVSDIRARVRRE